ncbi:hypothetical protein STEG23_003560 [Scotinomys teguina]
MERYMEDLDQRERVDEMEDEEEPDGEELAGNGHGRWKRSLEALGVEAAVLKNNLSFNKAGSSLDDKSTPAGNHTILVIPSSFIIYVMTRSGCRIIYIVFERYRRSKLGLSPGTLDDVQESAAVTLSESGDRL